MSNEVTPAMRKCMDAVKLMGLNNPQFLLIHTKLQYIEKKNDPNMQTMGITSDGTVYINPDFVMKITEWKQLAGVMAHEMLHLVLQHHVRGLMYDQWQWNIATDMCINWALRKDGIELPGDCFYPPEEYISEGNELYAEALYEWIKKNPQKQPKQKGDGKQQPSPGAGCAVLAPGEGDRAGQQEEGPNGQMMPKESPDWRQVAIDARAMAQAAGKGSSAIAHLLSPRQAKINWKQVIKHGIDLAFSKPGRDFQTFARRHRRSPAEGIQYPGWRGFEPRVAVVIDVSGSMNREWVDMIVAECKRLSDVFPSMKMYLVSHTSEVVWEGWIDRNTQGKFSDACQFSGGTDPDPAYAAVAKQGKFDTMIHFTDCEFFREWPKSPARNLVVGAFTRKISTQPPANAHIIPCDIEGY